MSLLWALRPLPPSPAPPRVPNPYKDSVPGEVWTGHGALRASGASVLVYKGL